MLQLKQLTGQIDFTHNVAGIVTAIQELSVLEMQKIRNRVLYIRDYMDGLLDIFVDVQIDYEKELAKEKKSDARVSPANRKVAMVLLSQDARFSDVNISQVFQTFTDDLPNFPQADILTVGQIAANFVSSSQTVQGHTVDDFSKKSLNELFATLQKYHQIILYYGQFKNLLQQNAQKQELSGHELLLATQQNAERIPHQFLYEPEVTTLISYFEQEVQRNILAQATNESRLAHLGSRIQTLEYSRNTIKDKLHKLDLEFTRAKRQQQAKKQLQRLAGRRMWTNL